MKKIIKLVAYLLGGTFIGLGVCYLINASNTIYLAALVASPVLSLVGFRNYVVGD